MITFSRSEDYAIILINKLSLEYDKRLVTLTEIAREYDISLFFLRNLAIKLRTAGLIQATEGKTGGYALTNAPEKIKMGDILQVFSNNQVLICCPKNKDNNRTCPQQENCIAGNNWRDLNKEFINKVYELTFSDFMKFNKKQN